MERLAGDSGRLLVTYGHGARSTLVPVWAGEGFPSDVARALDDARRHDQGPGESLVVVARRMSPGARRQLDEKSISWVDEAGHAHIAAEPGLYVLIEKQRPVDKDPGPSVLRWSEATGAVAEAILTRATSDDVPLDYRRRLPAVTTLAKDLGLSAGLVSRTLRSFDVEEWTTKRGAERGATSRRELVDPGALLSGWAGWYRTWRRPTALAHGLIGDTDAFLSRLGGAWAGHWWAVTGSILLERRAPFLTSAATVDVYLDQEAFADPNTLHRLLDQAGLRLVDSGARVQVHQADEYLERLVSGPPGQAEVTDIRLYGDLVRSGVRGDDAAEHLRETRIGF